MVALLQTWCDGLLAHQVTRGDNRGGLQCPACGFVHGRCGDALYPFLTLYSRTGDEKYRHAALEVYEWSERHVAQPDGSWRNENCAGAWLGTTCFSLLALSEALRHDSHHLTTDTHRRWTQRLCRGADFLLDYMTFDIGDINYPISTSAALASAWAVLGDHRYRERARELAYFGLEHFTENGLLWGEGPRGKTDKSPRGLRPIDIGYNVEESLPNLALYGAIMQDETVLDAVTVSLRAHLPFLLPDGGWDAGWCSRQYKWTYWGSRTSDGCAAGFAALQARDTRFAPAAARNLRLLSDCTHDGLLHGGPHLHERGIAPCIHHTFCHAKGLAAALHAGLTDAEPASKETPKFGVREWCEASVVQVVCGEWRASITTNDLAHTAKRGGYPSGGSLTLLWHEKTGLLCAASMNDYVRYEGTNMQIAANASDQFVLTPRIEIHASGECYSSLHDRTAQREWNTDGANVTVSIKGVLTSQGGSALTGGNYQVTYRFKPASFELMISCDLPNVRLIFPLVSSGDEHYELEEQTLAVHKRGAVVRAQLEGCRWDKQAINRVFNFVPGAEALPLSAILNGEARITIHIERMRFTGHQVCQS